MNTHPHPNTENKRKGFSIKTIPGYVKNYTKNCRYSFNTMLSL